MVFTLCVSRYNTTLFLNRLQEGEGGLYMFYAINDETNASITFSISVKCKCLALLFHSACPGAAAQLAAGRMDYKDACSPVLTQHNPNPCIAQGFLVFYCCAHGK